MMFNNQKAWHSWHCTNIGTYKLFPAHMGVPTISEGDQTIVAATDLLDVFKKITPVNAAQNKKSLQNAKFAHQCSFCAPTAKAQQVDHKINGKHATFEGRHSIKFEGG